MLKANRSASRAATIAGKGCLYNDDRFVGAPSGPEGENEQGDQEISSATRADLFIAQKCAVPDLPSPTIARASVKISMCLIPQISIAVMMVKTTEPISALPAQPFSRRMSQRIAVVPRSGPDAGPAV